MSAFVLPERLAASSGDGSAAFAAWRESLPERIAAVGQRWELEVGEPFHPGGATAWVAPARGAGDADLVLKLAWSHHEARDEAAGLAAWAGHGAVGVERAWVDGKTTALLLERCRPGRTLAESLPEPEQDAVIAGLLRRLWEAEPPPGTFRALHEMCDAWAAEHEARARPPGPHDPGLERECRARFRALPRTATETALLATDLHAENVLAAEREPWLVIDPKPYVGDPAYDVTQHLLNCDRLPADPVGLARRMADLAGVDGDRVLEWLLARAVLEAGDWPEPAAVAAVARTLARAVG